jgi:hypothetical protein
MGDGVIELVKALAWPVAAAAISIAFYEPLSRLFEALGARATKLSVFKIEIELSSGARPSASPSLEEIRNPQLALLGDSGPMLFQQVQDVTPADYAVIDLGDGEEWLTSRLFIGAAMLQRMRGVECLVFVARVGSLSRRLLAVASVGRIRWALAQRYPWLEAAFACAYGEAQPGAGRAHFPPIGQIPAVQPAITSFTGGIAPSRANALVNRFIELVQDTSAGTGPDWVDLSRGRQERADWVTEPLLSELLPAEAYEMWAYEERDKSRADRVRAVLRRRSPFVALVNPDRQFSRLIDRRALLEEVVVKMDD